MDGSAMLHVDHGEGWGWGGIGAFGFKEAGLQSEDVGAELVVFFLKLLV